MVSLDRWINPKYAPQMTLMKWQKLTAVQSGTLLVIQGDISEYVCPLYSFLAVMNKKHESCCLPSKYEAAQGHLVQRHPPTCVRNETTSRRLHVVRSWNNRARQEYLHTLHEGQDAGPECGQEQGYTDRLSFRLYAQRSPRLVGRIRDVEDASTPLPIACFVHFTPSRGVLGERSE